MKKSIICLMAVLLVSVSCAGAYTVSPEIGDELYIPYRYPLYDSPDRAYRCILTLVPADSVVIYLSDIDWGIFVVYGNYAGYLEYPEYTVLTEGRCDISPSSVWQEDVPDRSYVPEFPYKATSCVPNQNLATRSGPNTKYTWTERFPESTDVPVYYQAEGNGVMWGYFEFESDGSRYRLYTGMKRVDGYRNVPVDDDEYTWAAITETHVPHYGPGTDYKQALYTICAGSSVKAYYQQNGWLLYEYETSDGKLQRAWAPPECWE